MNSVTLPASRVAKKIGAVTCVMWILLAINVALILPDEYLLFKVLYFGSTVIYSAYTIYNLRPRTFRIESDTLSVKIGKQLQSSIPLADIERARANFDRVLLVVKGNNREFDAKDPTQILNLLRQTGEFQEEYGGLVRR